MEEPCIFCNFVQERSIEFFFEDKTGSFLAFWDAFPAFPGHALVIPKRHVQYFRQLNDHEMANITYAVAEVKNFIEKTDLRKIYPSVTPVSEKSAQRIAEVTRLLEKYDYQPPLGFNDGINDGPAAGQSVAHLHWHVLPRWEPEPGGIIHSFTGK